MSDGRKYKVHMAYHRKCHHCGTPYHISFFLKNWHDNDFNKSLPEPFEVSEGGFSAKVWDGFEGLYYGNVIVYSCPGCREITVEDECVCGGELCKTGKMGRSYGDLYKCECGRVYEQNGSEFDLVR